MNGDEVVKKVDRFVKEASRSKMIAKGLAGATALGGAGLLGAEVQSHAPLPLLVDASTGKHMSRSDLEDYQRKLEEAYGLNKHAAGWDRAWKLIQGAFARGAAGKPYRTGARNVGAKARVVTGPKNRTVTATKGDKEVSVRLPAGKRRTHRSGGTPTPTSGRVGFLRGGGYAAGRAQKWVKDNPLPALGLAGVGGYVAAKD